MRWTAYPTTFLVGEDDFFIFAPERKANLKRRPAGARADVEDPRCPLAARLGDKAGLAIDTAIELVGGGRSFCFEVAPGGAKGEVGLVEGQQALDFGLWGNGRNGGTHGKKNGWWGASPW